MKSLKELQYFFRAHGLHVHLRGFRAAVTNGAGVVDLALADPDLEPSFHTWATKLMRTATSSLEAVPEVHVAILVAHVAKKGGAKG